MSIHTRHQRHESTQLGKLHRYTWYAIGEVILIFAGITLALWFSNWNEERQIYRLEMNALVDIAANLQANVAHIESNISDDLQSVASCKQITGALESRQPWLDEYGSIMLDCRWWTSPFLSSAAYESLKSRGTDLITDQDLRNAIMALYEQRYADLVNDMDKGFWQFQGAVLHPVLNRYMRRPERERFVPNNWQACLDSHEFGNMLYEKIAIQLGSIEHQQGALDETRRVIEQINAWIVSQEHN